MATVQRLMVILILFIPTGCEEPAVPAQQASPDATERAVTKDEPGAVPTPPDATSETPKQANEITGKVVGIIDGDTIDILTAGNPSTEPIATRQTRSCEAVFAIVASRNHFLGLKKYLFNRKKIMNMNAATTAKAAKHSNKIKNTFLKPR